MNENQVPKEGTPKEQEARLQTGLPPAHDVPVVPLQGELSLVHLLSLLDVSPDALVIVDEVGRITHVNSQAEVLFGYLRSELEGLSLEVLLPERIRASHVLHRQHYTAAPHTRPMGIGLELFVRRKDGREVPVDISLRPFQLAGSLHVLAAIRDITERRELEARERAARQEAEQLKDDFISIAAHELRSPLAVLKGLVQTLLIQMAKGNGPVLADWQTEALQGIEQATDRLVELTEDLLDVTRLQAGRLTLHVEAIELVALVKRVVKRLQMTTQQHSISISTPLEYLVVQVDPRRIEQVLSNLIGNAIKYSPQGGRIDVRINEEPDRQMAQLAISDQGIGIPDQQQSVIFGRFARADNARAYGIGGTGLGLYLCSELVERQGGDIRFESTEGQGSTFFVSLPMASETESEV